MVGELLVWVGERGGKGRSTFLIYEGADQIISESLQLADITYQLIDVGLPLLP